MPWPAEDPLSIAKSSLLFSGGTLISRIAGLVRDRVILAAFGASAVMDGFWVAFRIPNLLRDMLAEGALGSSFTKVYSAVCAEDEDRKRAQTLLWQAFWLMTLVSLVVCALGVALAPWLVRLITADKEGSAELIATATGLTRLLFPFLGFMSLGAIAMGALHQKGRFFLTAVSPLMFNIFSILGALVFAPLFVSYAPDWVEGAFADKAITGLAVGTLLGGLAQLLLQLTGIVRELRQGFREARFRLPWSPEVKKMLWLMGPITLAASAGQINTMVNNYFATTAEVGAVTWLYASFRLLHFPIGIFGVAIGAAVLPALSRTLSKAAGVVNDAASGEMQNTIEMVLWMMTPCFVFYLLNDLAMVQCLFQSGRYSDHDAAQTALALRAYSYALISYGLSKVMTSFYFAMDRTSYALRVSLITVATNVIANYMLVERYGHQGLAYGYSLTQGLSVSLLIWGMRGYGVKIAKAKFLRSLSMLIGAALLSGFLMQALSTQLSTYVGSLSLPLWLASGLTLLVNGLLCVAIFLIAGLSYLRLSPKAAWRRLQGRRRSS